MRLTPTFTRIGLVAVLGLGLLGSCKKKSSDPSPTTPLDSNRATGLSGGDNVSTIPSAINFGAVSSSTTLPDMVDLSDYLPTRGDQGQYGTCVAWATAYNCKSAMEAIKFGYTPAQLAQTTHQMSPLDLFTNVPDDKKGAADCNGTDFVPALEVVLNRGVATMAAAPYTGFTGCEKANNRAAWDNDATNHKINNYRKLGVTADIDASVKIIKQELVNKSPVILGAKLADNFMTWNTEDVYQNHSSFDQVGIHSYHAMCIVGYNNAKGPHGAFKVVNSWSNNWGADGFIWVDYNFMINGFSFNQNFFTASNANQNPNPDVDPTPGPVPTPSGVDLTPWVYSDDRNGGTNRRMLYDIFNLGSATAPASAEWGAAYVYYNAYNANDYGLAFIVGADPSITRTTGPFECGINTNNTVYCLFNTDISGSSSLATEINSLGVYQNYPMPAITGDYYLVMVADVTGEFTEEDEDNNLFYTTNQLPLHFNNGVGGRRDGEAKDPLAFLNPVSKGQSLTTPLVLLRTPQAADLRTARRPGSLNAYSPKEIVALLKDRVRSGDFAAKVAAYGRARAANPALYESGFVRK